MRLIGQRWKCGNTCSWLILIGRGLDQIGSIHMRFSDWFWYLVFSFEGTLTHLSGGHSEEVPPVPIPNTEVKLLSVENTWWATAREDRTLPEQINGRSSLTSSVKHIYVKCLIFSQKCDILITKTKYSSIAQSVERMTVNHDVAGSSPAGGAKRSEWFRCHLNCSLFSMVWGLVSKISFEAKG